MHALQSVSILVFLIGSMLGIGLKLSPREMVSPLRDTRLVALALGLNFVIAPALAWILMVIIPLERGHAIGLLLLSGASGAPFLPKLVETARGDLSLAIALMALLTLGTIFFIPFALPHMITGMDAAPWPIARPLLLFIVLPMGLGMLLKSWAPSLAERLAPVCTAAGNGALILLFVLLVALNASALVGVIGSGAILAVMLDIIGLLAAGWLLGGRNVKTAGTLGLATAARNFGAAMVPAANNFDDPKVTVMLIVSAVVCLVITFSAAAWVRRRT